VSLSKFLTGLSGAKFDSLRHDTAVRFDSPLHYAAKRFGYQLHIAAEISAQIIDLTLNCMIQWILLPC
jgi:hypothetical protein